MSRKTKHPPPPEPGAYGLLDWRDSWHHARAAAPCRYCGEPTHLRETPTKPAHKVCAEAAARNRAEAAQDTYRKDTL